MLYGLLIRQVKILDYILEAQGLTKYFDVKSGSLFGEKRFVHAVENVTFGLKHNETLGIVGESGSGKSTLARVILGLLPITGGKVFYNGKDITGLKGSNAKYRSELQMIFQDPHASLNPKLTVGNAISEPIIHHNKGMSKAEIKKRAVELLELVGLSEEMYSRFPHEFSGGQCQRIGIARSLAVSPKVLFCDESVSALDVSVQAQILNVFNDLKKRFNLTYVFIGHDLAVVKYISDRILVMYLGEVVEMAETETLFGSPLHPYTLALISAILEPKTNQQSERIILEGDIPSPIDPPSGCRFRTRCFNATEECAKCQPELKEVNPGHFVRCHYALSNKKTTENKEG